MFWFRGLHASHLRQDRLPPLFDFLTTFQQYLGGPSETWSIVDETDPSTATTDRSDFETARGADPEDGDPEAEVVTKLCMASASVVTCDLLQGGS